MSNLYVTAPKTQGLIQARMYRLSPFSLPSLVQWIGGNATLMQFPSTLSGRRKRHLLNQ